MAAVPYPNILSPKEAYKTLGHNKSKKFLDEQELKWQNSPEYVANQEKARQLGIDIDRDYEDRSNDLVGPRVLGQPDDVFGDDGAIDRKQALEILMGSRDNVESGPNRAYRDLDRANKEALKTAPLPTGLPSSLRRELPQAPGTTLGEQAEMDRWESSELATIKKHEGGFYPEVYKDSVRTPENPKGIDTIGYGFNLQRPEAQGVLNHAGIYKSVGDLRSKKESLTEEEAEILVRLEYPMYEDAARRFVGSETWDSMPRDKQNVLTNMSFNLGETGLNKFTKFRTALQAGDYTKAAAEMDDSTWKDQVKTRATEPVTGLIARMKAPAKMAASAPMIPNSNLQNAIARALGSVMEQGG